MVSYLRRLAEQIAAEVDSPISPREDDPSLLIYAVLLRAKGTAVTESDIHDAWVASRELLGGRDEDFVPFEELSAETQAKDEPFARAVTTVARRYDER